MARRSDHTREQLRKMAIDSAVKIIDEEQFDALTVRRVTKEIGYTPGTLYQMFDNIDALVLEVHIRTLNELYEACSNIKFSGQPSKDLAALAAQYTRFAGQNRKRWNALFEFSAEVDVKLQRRYDSVIGQLIGLVVRALVPIYPENQTVRTKHDARVLWAALYGIVSLASMGKLSESEDADNLVNSLIHNYLAGMRVHANPKTDKIV